MAQDKQQSQQQTKKQPRHKRESILSVRNLFWFCLILAATGIMIAFAHGRENERLSAASINLSHVSFQIRKGNSADYRPLSGHHIARLDVNAVVILNSRGVETDRFSITLNKPVFQQAGAYALVADLDGYDYLLLKDDKLIYSARSEDPIKGLSVNDGGMAALLLDHPDTMGLLRVLQPDGSKLFDWTALDRTRSGYVIGMAFDSPGSTLFVSLYNTEAESGDSIIQRMSLKSANPGQIIDSFKATHVGPVTFLADLGNQGQFMASGTHLIHRYPNGTISSLRFRTLSQVIVSSGSFVCLGIPDDQEQADQLGLYSWDGQAEHAVRMDEIQYNDRCKLFANRRGRLYVTRGMQAFSFNNLRSDPAAFYQDTDNIDMIYVSEGNRMVVISETHVSSLQS